jgi:hypothetical protein
MKRMDNQELDLFKDWQKLASEKFSSNNIQKQEIMDAIHKDSNSTISTLKKSLKVKIMWVIEFITLFSTWMLFSLDRPELLMIIGAINVSYFVALILLISQYKKMDSELDITGNTLSIMKRNLKLISKALKIEQTWGLLTLPSAIIVGVLISRHYNGYTIMDTFSDPSYLLKIIIMMIVILPLAYIMTNKMNKIAFGKYIDKLKENITRMELIQ